MFFQGSAQGFAKAVAFLTDLCSKHISFDIVPYQFITKSQRGYLHVLIDIVAIHFGVTHDEAKDDYYKRLANPDVYVYSHRDPLSGNWSLKLKSSERLPKEVIAETIDRFKIWAAQECGLYLPEAENEKAMQAAEEEIKRNKKYLYA